MDPLAEGWAAGREQRKAARAEQVDAQLDRRIEAAEQQIAHAKSERKKIERENAELQELAFRERERILDQARVEASAIKEEAMATQRRALLFEDEMREAARNVMLRDVEAKRRAIKQMAANIGADWSVKMQQIIQEGGK